MRGQDRAHHGVLDPRRQRHLEPPLLDFLGLSGFADRGLRILAGPKRAAAGRPEGAPVVALEPPRSGGAGGFPHRGQVRVGNVDDQLQPLAQGPAEEGRDPPVAGLAQRFAQVHRARRRREPGGVERAFPVARERPHAGRVAVQGDREHVGARQEGSPGPQHVDHAQLDGVRVANEPRRRGLGQGLDPQPAVEMGSQFSSGHGSPLRHRRTPARAPNP